MSIVTLSTCQTSAASAPPAFEPIFLVLGPRPPSSTKAEKTSETKKFMDQKSGLALGGLTVTGLALYTQRDKIKTGYKNYQTKRLYKEAKKAIPDGQCDLITLKNKRLAIVMDMPVVQQQKPWVQSLTTQFAQNRYTFNQGYNPVPFQDALDGALIRGEKLPMRVIHKVIATGSTTNPEFLGGVRLMMMNTAEDLPFAVIKMSGATDAMSHEQKFEKGWTFLRKTFGAKLSKQIQTIGELGGMVVVPKLRSNGVVNTLYSSALDSARANNVDLLVGTITQENIGGAPHLTQKLKFDGVIDFSVLLDVELRNGVKGFQLARMYADTQTTLGRALIERMQASIQSAISYTDFLRQVTPQELPAFKELVLDTIQNFKKGSTEILGKKVREIIRLDLTGFTVAILKNLK